MGTKAKPLDHNGRHIQTLPIHHCGNNTLNMTFFVHDLSSAQIPFTFFTLNGFFVELFAIAVVILVGFCAD
jgi:hypothetical protein